MMNFSAEKVQEIVEEKEAEYKKLEEEYSFLKEEFEDLKAECEDLEDRCESYKKANKTILCIYHEDSKKMDDLQKLNNKLVKSNKTANRDFFILAAAYVATLMLMIYLFIR
jgi:predicted nucleotidyltransferase